jgi:hypothetical protein
VLYPSPEDRAAYESDRLLAATADDAPTMREKIDILFAAGQMPSGDQIFDLLMEDRVAHYAFIRAIDWVLWRLAHGKPVKVLGAPDRTSAAIDARFDAAREFASPKNCSPCSTDADVHLLCAGQMIQQWERTPERQAQIDKDNEMMMSILEECEAVFERK